MYEKVLIMLSTHLKTESRNAVKPTWIGKGCSKFLTIQTPKERLSELKRP